MGVDQELDLQALHRRLRQAAWLPDIHAAVHRLQEAGLDVRMLTDQPSTVTDFLARWGLTRAVSSPVTVREGRQLAIDFREDKLANLLGALADGGPPLDRVCHVGNGSNDVPVWQAVGGSLAVFATPDVARYAQRDLGEAESALAISDAVLALHRGGK